MATIVILRHEHQRNSTPGMIHLFIGRWQAMGHRVLIHHGAGRPPPGDIAVLHIDLTVIPPGYRTLISHYPRVINGAVLDISKRRISRNLLERTSSWCGPVIVKTNANYFGLAERDARPRRWFSVRSVRAHEFPYLDAYKIYESIGAVPERYWNTPGIVVEKFLPEHDERGYYIRTWTFLGRRERSFRHRGTDPIVKLGNIVESEPVDVPEEIRSWRETLGFDYGKFDYVCHEGRPILFDANRTPGAPFKGTPSPNMLAGMNDLAEGISDFVDETPRAAAKRPLLTPQTP